MPTNDSNPTPITPIDPQARALEVLTPRIVAMTAEDVLRDTKLDATHAGTVGAATAKKLAPYRATLVAQFGAESGARVDDLPMLARACQQADIAEAAAAAPSDLTALYQEVREHYDILLTDAQSLVNRKFLPATELDKARDTRGYEGMVRSTLILVTLLRAWWPKLKDHTPLKDADLDRGQQLAEHLRDTIGERDQAVQSLPAVEVRLRALSLLVRSYVELRREMSYLRWYQEDVDAIVPSLWAGRGRRARSETSDVTPEDGIPEEEAVTPSGPVTPGTPVNPGGNPLLEG
jgi:hypothetical protein